MNEEYQLDLINDLCMRYNRFLDKPNNHRSLELRRAINEVRKNASQARQTLREFDDKGYKKD